MKEYKVEQAGSPKEAEDMMNRMAQEGWEVRYLLAEVGYGRGNNV